MTGAKAKNCFDCVHCECPDEGRPWYPEDYWCGEVHNTVAGAGFGPDYSGMAEDCESYRKA